MYIYLKTISSIIQRKKQNKKNLLYLQRRGQRKEWSDSPMIDKKNPDYYPTDQLECFARSDWKYLRVDWSNLSQTEVEFRSIERHIQSTRDQLIQ